MHTLREQGGNVSNKRSVTLRDLVVVIGIFALTLGIVAVVIEIFNKEHGYLVIVLAMFVSLSIFMIDRTIVYRRFVKEQELLISDIELKDLLYNLMEKTADYENNYDLYDDILKAAIDAVTFGEKGSIIDVRNKERVAYIAVEGFEKEVLEEMNLGYKDTYLFKETDGLMDRTVIIRNSVNYNQLHANDELVRSLIEAGTAAIRSTICTPIRLHGEVIGMLNIDSSKKNAFAEKDVQVIEIFAMEVGKIIKYHEIIQENLYLSHYDAMTQIYNRAYFYELHKNMFHDTVDSSYIFIATDIDNLKVINDAYGHSIGDELIKHYVKGIQLYLPEDAVFGRYGGDEFNILVPDSEVLAIEKMMKDIGVYFQKNPIFHNKQKIYVSFSYGIINYPDEEIEYEALVIKADQRMYAQKKTLKG